MRANCVTFQASNLAHLFALIKNDVGKSAAPTEKAADLAIPAMPSGFVESESTGSDETPNYPKSLFLLLPLFDSYELNPVGYKAQERVSLPEGLDLDTPIADPALLQLEFSDPEEDSDDDVRIQLGDSENMAALQSALKRSEGSSRNKNSKGKRLNASGQPETKAERAEVGRLLS